MSLEDYIKGLDPELQERARACGSAEELMALAKEAEIPLPDEALAQIAGGAGGNQNCGTLKCSKCGSTDLDKTYVSFDMMNCKCNSCGYEFTVFRPD